MRHRSTKDISPGRGVMMGGMVMVFIVMREDVFNLAGYR